MDGIIMISLACGIYMLYGLDWIGLDWIGLWNVIQGGWCCFLGGFLLDVCMFGCE